MKIAVFASGNGSNLQALIDAQEKGGLGGGNIVLVVSDNPEAFALQRAEKAGIKTFVLIADGFDSREEYDKTVLQKLAEEGIELIVLAGFMRVLSACFIGKYKERILNVHPALLPAFKGAHGIKDAFECGVKTTGVTIHFVINELDAGPIISQKAVTVEEASSVEELEEKIHIVEHKLYPEAVKLFVQGKLKINGKKVKVLT